MPRQCVQGAMREAGPRRLDAECAQHSPVGNRTQRDDHAAARNHGDFSRQVVIALPHLRRQRLVGGWQALHGIGDAAVAESEAVVARH